MTTIKDQALAVLRQLDESSGKRSFRDTICSAVSLRAESPNQYRVLTPFVYDDGDHLSIVLRRDNGDWVLSDEASTYMHLSYELDDRALETGTRQKIIADTLAFFGIEDDGGELRTPISGDEYGKSLYSLIQTMLRISNVTFLSRERAESTFKEDLEARRSERGRSVRSGHRRSESGRPR